MGSLASSRTPRQTACSRSMVRSRGNSRSGSEPRGSAATACIASRTSQIVRGPVFESPCHAPVPSTPRSSIVSRRSCETSEKRALVSVSRRVAATAKGCAPQAPISSQPGYRATGRRGFRTMLAHESGTCCRSRPNGGRRRAWRRGYRTPDWPLPAGRRWRHRTRLIPAHGRKRRDGVSRRWASGARQHAAQSTLPNPVSIKILFAYLRFSWCRVRCAPASSSWM